MQTLDLILLLCFVPGMIRGLSKGFLEQALSLAGVVVSVWAAFRFSAALARWLQPYLTLSDTVLQLTAFVLVLIAVAFGMLLLAKALTKIIEMALLGWLNRLLGFVFAVGVTALILGVVIILFDTLNVRFEMIRPQVLEASVLWGAIRELAYAVFPFLKELLLK